MKYIVTDKGPLDRHAPGEDVTGLYDPVTLARLVKDGYVVEVKPKAKAPRGYPK